MMLYYKAMIYEYYRILQDRILNKFFSFVNYGDVPCMLNIYLLSGTSLVLLNSTYSRSLQGID